MVVEGADQQDCGGPRINTCFSNQVFMRSRLI
jgi:hypothetical protein